MRRFTVVLLLGLLFSLLAAPGGRAQRLFTGLETSSPLPTRSSDLSGFPAVSWQNHFAFDVSGAAATPEGKLFLCQGPFTTYLYESTLAGPPQLLCTVAADMSALAFGRGTLWGYSNYADPKGIYAIDPGSGAVTLVLDVHTGTGFRFFGLDYNPVDDRLYGYTEYGASGLYRIDIDSGEMTRVAGPIPASNTQGRGLAVGRNTVFLTATRGADDIPFFAYDLEQGIDGQWVPFTQAYPDQHATGGAAWIPDPTASTGDGRPRAIAPALRLVALSPNPAPGAATIVLDLPAPARVTAGLFDAAGRLVVRLDAGERAAGRSALHWNGRGPEGAALPAGGYFLRVSAGGEAVSRPLAIVR